MVEGGTRSPTPTTASQVRSHKVTTFLNLFQLTRSFTCLATCPEVRQPGHAVFPPSPAQLTGHQSGTSSDGKPPSTAGPPAPTAPEQASQADVAFVAGSEEDAPEDAGGPAVRTRSRSRSGSSTDGSKRKANTEPATPAKRKKLTMAEVEEAKEALDDPDYEAPTSGQEDTSGEVPDRSTTPHRRKSSHPKKVTKESVPIPPSPQAVGEHPAQILLPPDTVSSK